MNKTLIALSLALAASTGAFTAAQAEDGFQLAPNNNSQPIFVAGVVTDFDGASSVDTQRAGIDYTATASIKQTLMSEQMHERLYDY